MVSLNRKFMSNDDADTLAPEGAFMIMTGGKGPENEANERVHEMTSTQVHEGSATSLPQHCKSSWWV